MSLQPKRKKQSDSNTKICPHLYTDWRHINETRPTTRRSRVDLKFKGKEMKDHLDKAKAKLTDKYGSLDNVDYKKAMIVGAPSPLSWQEV